MTLKEIYQPIQPAILQVERELEECNGQIAEFFKSGKRLRPALVLFASDKSSKSTGVDVIRTAAAAELIHNASLIHDDIMDDAAERRDRPTAHQFLGIKPAIIAADYLFTQALSMLEPIKPSAILPLFIRMVKAMCTGQWQELSLSMQNNCTTETYLNIIDLKTAQFFASCCKAGGLLRDASEKELNNLYNFGRNFGFMYQLLDDANDLLEESSNYLNKKIIEWGGKGYCHKLAKDYCEYAKTNLAEMTEGAGKEGLEKILLFFGKNLSDRKASKTSIVS